jgi:hypothetical protein
VGYALLEKGDLPGAIAALQKAIALKPDHALAYCNLGRALQRQGRFAESLRACKTGHDLGSRQKDWPYRSAELVRQAERLVELDAKLPSVLSGEAKPKGVAEQLELGDLCRGYKGLNAAAARLYAGTFEAEPKLAEDPRSARRYNAACAAALAGCGQGKDAGNLNDKERARLRCQALHWLRSDLAAWREHLKADETRALPILRRAMEHWLAVPCLAGVRNPKALAKLPEAERQDWHKLWADAQELFAKAGGKISQQQK